MVKEKSKSFNLSFGILFWAGAVALSVILFYSNLSCVTFFCTTVFGLSNGEKKGSGNL